MIRFVAILGVIFFLSTPAQAKSEADLWQAISSGEAIAMMRHALAPGTGDPSAFNVNDCTTQRNLDAVGRAQSSEIGARFRAAGITKATVLSSAWCRCWQTAELLGLGDYQVYEPLNSFFRNRSKGPGQIAALREALKDQRDGATVWVTHQVNITGLTNVWPQSGEIIVIAPGANDTVEILGRIMTGYQR